jgi:molybdopterin synthase sulfur carrier subunit
MSLRLLYFARLAEQLGRRDETVELPPGTGSVAHLRAWLAARGGPWEVLGDNRRALCALDHTLARDDAPLAGVAEAAFFPPVTGG